MRAAARTLLLVALLAAVVVPLSRLAWRDRPTGPADGRPAPDPVGRARPEANVLATLELQLRPWGAARDVSLWVALPVEVPGRQEVLSLETSHPIARTLHHPTGNRIARFDWPALDTTTRLVLEAELRVAPFSLEDGSPRPPLADDERWRFVGAEPGLEAGHPEIVRVARGIDGEGLPWIEAALRRVVEHVRYDGYVPDRPGALATLRAGAGDCSDLTDLLVALCRARGVPARHVYGLALEGHATSRHSWAEIEHPDGGWIPIDPLHVKLGTSRFGDLPADRVRLAHSARDPAIDPHWFYRWSCADGALAVTFRPGLRFR